MIKVFVYGTLKPGEANYKRYCADKVVDAKRAYAYGKLFALPMGYPAMTMGSRPVHGYLLFFADSEVLSQLDELEGYQQTKLNVDNLYNRQQIEIYEPQGRSLDNAWVYLMTQEQVYQLGGIYQEYGWWSGCGLKASPSYQF